MNYYDRILNLISEVKVSGRKVTQPPQQVMRHSDGRIDYRNDTQADIEDATRILRKNRRGPDRGRGARRPQQNDPQSSNSTR